MPRQVPVNVFNPPYSSSDSTLPGGSLAETVSSLLRVLTRMRLPLSAHQSPTGDKFFAAHRVVNDPMLVMSAFQNADRNGEVRNALQKV